MTKFSEEQLSNWTKPPSETEKSKLENAERLVKEAISNDEKLKKLRYDVFGQGSYANDTNVRNDSDIDINVRLSSTVFVDARDGKTDKEHGYTDSSYKFSEYKEDVYNALVQKFGAADVTRNDKCITVKANSYRVETDVVPTFKLYRHDPNGEVAEGVKFISDSLKAITNYPLQHIDNGKNKNANTQKRFKRLTRIFRRLRYKMIDDNVPINDNITSFLLECLVYNIPDEIFNNNHTWTDRLRAAIVYLYGETKKESENCKDWGEVSELLYLFYQGRKWSIEDVNEYLIDMWQYLEFD